MTHDQNMLYLMQLVHTNAPRRKTTEQPAVIRLRAEALGLQNALRADFRMLDETAKRLRDGLRRMRKGDERALAAIRQYRLADERRLKAIRHNLKMDQKALDERVALTQKALRQSYTELTRPAEQLRKRFDKVVRNWGTVRSFPVRT